MKTGKSLVELAKELERQNKSKKDFIAPSVKMEFKAVSKEKKTEAEPRLKLDKLGEFKLDELAEEQISRRFEIPVKYYNRMKENDPELLETNVNRWMLKSDDKFLVRTMDNRARAFLSNKYRPLDNYDLSEAVLPELSNLKVNIVSAEITNKHLYLKAVTERVTAEIQKGDVVQAGIVISNSEVGCGSVKVEPMIYRLVCLNGMISDDNSLRKYHIGRRGDIDELGEYFRDETRRTDDKAFWMKVRDIVRSALGAEIFKAGVEKMKRAVGNVIDVKPAELIKVVERVGSNFGLFEGEQHGILAHLLKGGDLNQYGLVNAVTRTSQEVEDYERATDLERMGGQILELNGRPWENLVRVAA